MIDAQGRYIAVGLRNGSSVPKANVRPSCQ